MKCCNCHREISDNAAFCKFCGTSQNKVLGHMGMENISEFTENMRIPVQKGNFPSSGRVGLIIIEIVIMIPLVIYLSNYIKI